MLYRKVQKNIDSWLKNDKDALLITGARQVGKTFIIKECLKRNNCDFVSFNLIEQKEIIDIMNLSSLNAKIFVERLSLITNHKLIKGKTVIFLDEIQECKEIVTFIKFLVQDGSFKYILSGSLLGVELNNIKSAPVGYLKTLKMFPLDLEEFYISLGISENIIERIKNSFDNNTEVDDFIHKKLIEAFNLYLVIGGMPEAVSNYIQNHDFNSISTIHLNIIEQYKKDFSKYEKENKYKLLKTYDLIPSELSKQNKRYNFTNLDSNLKYDRYENSFNWLIDSGVTIPVFNITQPKLPLLINKKSNLFKLFLSDVGLLTSLYGKSTQLTILGENKSLNAGAIYENFVAQELNSHGFKCYYYNSKKYGELDFVIEYKDTSLPIEVKSGKDYVKHSAINNVLKEKSYQINKCIVLSSFNVKKVDSIYYYPIYMLMFIDNKYIETPKLNKIDLSTL